MPNHDSRLLEHAVLHELIELHPARLTPAELRVWVAADPENAREKEAIGYAIRDLRRSGLVRLTGATVEPTHAALRAAALFAED